ncbi:helix-turn-helix domain-containing protein [Sagittula stellata]|uniref:HTH cro/C1-type domain-containing protein n=2 Tax=Sagittula stellata TaxID=52603 RepID=A3K861_SAGS3|nr:hypothetical protein SSE37_09803 [Sagittula stellata E-37]
METIGSRIKNAADKVGGLDILASRIEGMSRRSLSDYVNGKTDPKVSLIEKIARETCVPVGWLVTGEGNMVQAQSQTNGPDRGVDWVINGPEGAVEVQAKRYQASQSRAEIDIDRLERAILTIERGIEDLEVRPTSSEKAELIAAAYQMYQAPTANTDQLILRMVKGS